VRAVDIRLELSNVTPRVWRVLRVPADLRLDDLHHAIQSVMGWDDFHAHVFEVGDAEYGPPPDDDDEESDEQGFIDDGVWAGEGKDVTVAQAFRQSPDGLTYVYNFGEDWRVRITRLGESDVDTTPAVACIGGENAGPQQESRDLDPFTVEGANRRLRHALRPRATPEFPAGPHANADQQLLANLTLVVLLLGSRPTRHGTREAWKNVRGEILDSLHEAGLIETDPQRKSVTITDAGVAQARRLIAEMREGRRRTKD
jgi:hypothetical protein